MVSKNHFVPLHHNNGNEAVILNLKIMNVMQKVFAIVNKETKEIVQFGFKAATVYEEWETYFIGTVNEATHELTETFMSRDDIKAQSSVN